MSAKKIAQCVLILIVPMLFGGCGGYTNPPSMPPATAPQLTLVANSISNSISIYAVNPQTGEPTMVRLPVLESMANTEMSLETILPT